MAVAERATAAKPRAAATDPAAKDATDTPPRPTNDNDNPSAGALNHVLGRLAVLDQRARSAGGEPTKPYDLLRATERAADEAQQHGAWLPLRDLATRLRLNPDEIDLLLAAAAPHLDPDVADVLDPGR